MTSNQSSSKYTASRFSGLELGTRSVLLLPLLVAAIAIGIYSIARPPESQALSSGIVISQIYTHGGTPGATFENDYVELFNRGNTPIDVAGWSVQYAVGNGAQSSSWTVFSLCGGSCVIPPHSYFLIQLGSRGTDGDPLPTPDLVGGTTNLSSNNGKIALVNTTTVLTGIGCPFRADVVDFVGYGNSANCSEGNAVAPNPGNNDQALCRKGSGFVETDNNTNDFELCTPSPRNSKSPTLAKIQSFTVTRHENGKVLLEWQTDYEVNNLGFNVYRVVGGRRTQINSEIIAGSALMVGPETRLTAGRSYRLWDNFPQGDQATYLIEDIDLSGRSEWGEPTVSDRLRSSEVPVGNVEQPNRALGHGGGRNASAPSESKAKLVKPTAALLETQSKPSSNGAVKVVIEKEGWYRVSQQELLAAGLDPLADPNHLQLFVDGSELPLAIVTNIDSQSPGAWAVEFYGVGIDARSTNKHVYWLVAGSKPGIRIRKAKAKGNRSPENSFPYTVEYRDRKIYFSSLRNGERENFFGALVRGGPVDQNLLVRYLDDSPEPANLEVVLQGVTLVPHVVSVFVNGEILGEMAFRDQEQGVARLAVPRSLLKEGENQVSLIPTGGERDISLIDRISLTYRRTYTADDNVLRFTARGKQRIRVGGFTDARVRVVDITDPADVREVASAVSKDVTYSVSFALPGKKERTLLAFAEDRIGKPAEVIADHPSKLRRERTGADLVEIGRRELAGSLEPLKAIREQNGLQVAIVDVEDIFDEFSFGQKTPQALKDYLAFAVSRWETTPRYVLLAGDASLDPKNYLGEGDFDLVPTKFIDTSNMETVSDDWFTDFDDDGLAEIPIARLPIRNEQEAAVIIGKILAYETATNSGGVLLVSDRNDGFDFSGAASALLQVIPADTSAEQVERRVGDEIAKAEFMNAISRGPNIVNYFGHGSVSLWKAGLLTNADVENLANYNQPSFFVMMTCLNGYFQDPVLDSLAEALLKADGRGAMAVWASSGMATPDQQLPMNLELFRSLLGGGSPPMIIGEAALKAKAAIRDADVRRTWILFGDPTMRLR